MGAAAYAALRVSVPGTLRARVPAHDTKGRRGGTRHAKGVLTHDANEAREGETFVR